MVAEVHFIFKHCLLNIDCTVIHVYNVTIASVNILVRLNSAFRLLKI